MTALDPRAGLPSASSLPRLAKCGASWHLAKLATGQGIGNYATVSSDSGHRIHKWLETQGADKWDAMTDDEKETAARCYVQAEAVIAVWGGDIDGCLAVRERRLWLYSGGAVAPWGRLGEEAIFSGCADLIVRGAEGRACIVDYKTGRSDYEPAPGNEQLLGLAVLVSGWTGARSIRVALVQPWAGPPSIADYDGAALDEAKAQLLDLLDHIEQPGLVPRPGDWCHFCPARGGICPATRNELAMLTDPTASTQESIAEAVKPLTADRLNNILHLAKRAEWTIEAAREEARRRIELNLPDAPPDFELREGAQTREVVNNEQFADLLGGDLTRTEFFAHCKVSLPAIEATLAKKSRLPKRTVVIRLKNAAGTLISYGRKAASLVERKPALEAAANELVE